MSDQVASREVVVGIAQGLHARPADQLAREARRWQSRIELLHDSQRVDGKSILEVLTLAAEAGTRLVVEATGPDAREAVEAIGGLFDRNFNEQEQGDGR
ncbi:MAG: HPr family phosphocarrier protein [Planctomycetia bacterium]|nr:HPr family phosphocarrier protein [Planctomycetia bacterium]